MNRPPPEWLLETVVHQAAKWLARNRSGEALGVEEKAAFMSWLRASPVHVHGYLEVARVMRAVPEALAALDAEPSDPRGGQSAVASDNVLSFRAPLVVGTAAAVGSRPTNPMMRRAFRVAAAAVIVWAFVLLAGDTLSFRSESRVITAPYSRVRLVQLEDGSTVYLRGGTAIAILYSRGSRSVNLLRGQALFHVIHDAGRPFRVQSGATEVVDVGTQFDVEQGIGHTTVTVVEGKVDVLEQGPKVAARAGSPASLRMVTVPLSAGEQVEVGPAVVTPHIETVDIRPVTAWAHRYISFDNRPLGEVITEINQYATMPVVITEPSLRSLRVSGVFDAYDTESLLLFLAQHGEIERTPRAIYVHGRAPAPRAPPSSAMP